MFDETWHLREVRWLIDRQDEITFRQWACMRRYADSAYTFRRLLEKAGLRPVARHPWTREELERIWDVFTKRDMMHDRESMYYDEGADSAFCEGHRQALAQVLNDAGLRPFIPLGYRCEACGDWQQYSEQNNVYGCHVCGGKRVSSDPLDATP